MPHPNMQRSQREMLYGSISNTTNTSNTRAVMRNTVYEAITGNSAKNPAIAMANNALVASKRRRIAHGIHPSNRDQRETDSRSIQDFCKSDSSCFVTTWQCNKHIPYPVGLKSFIIRSCYNRSSFLHLPFDIPYMPVFFFYDVLNLL